jgi:hypothetical protein
MGHQAEAHFTSQGGLRLATLVPHEQVDEESFSHWKRRLRQAELPAYQLIADLIAEDLQQGRLAPRERLPPLRTLAQELGLDYTTVVRGMALARERGLVASRPGLGTFTRGSFIGLPLRAGTGAEMTMNQPPEIDAHPAMRALQASAAEYVAGASMVELMRYQDFGGSPHEREVAAALRPSSRRARRLRSARCTSAPICRIPPRPRCRSGAVSRSPTSRCVTTSPSSKTMPTACCRWRCRRPSPSSRRG